MQSVDVIFPRAIDPLFRETDHTLPLIEVECNSRQTMYKIIRETCDESVNSGCMNRRPSVTLSAGVIVGSESLRDLGSGSYRVSVSATCLT
jgi:hypothetical protein